MIKTALAYARQQDDLEQTAVCLERLARASIIIESPEPVPNLLEEGLTIAEQLKDSFLKASLLYTFGRYFWMIGRIPEAINSLKQAIALMKSTGDVLGEGQVQQVLNRITLWDLGDFIQSKNNFEQLVSYYQRLNRSSIVAYNQVYLGYLAFLEGDFQKVKFYSQAGWEGLNEFGDDYYLDWANCLLGLSAFCHNQYQDALEFYNLGANLVYSTTLDRFLRHWGLVMVNYGLGKHELFEKQMVTLTNLALETPVKNALMIFVLPLGALFLWQKSKFEQAIEYLSLAYLHLKGMTGWIEKCQIFSSLKPNLEQASGTERFQAVWDRGQDLNLQQSVQSLLSQIQN